MGHRLRLKWRKRLQSRAARSREGRTVAIEDLGPGDVIRLGEGVTETVRQAPRVTPEGQVFVAVGAGLYLVRRMGARYGRVGQG